MCVSISKVLPRQRCRASFRYFSICGPADSASEDAFMKPVDADKLIISRGGIWLHSQLPSTRVYGDYQLIRGGEGGGGGRGKGGKSFFENFFSRL